MYSLHCTKKLLDRLKRPIAEAVESETRLGNWYATVLFWKPQMVLAVNEKTLLPVLLPLAPATTLVERFPQAVEEVLQALDMPEAVIARELQAMGQGAVCKTANRSLIGMMNEFSFLADSYRYHFGTVELIEVMKKLVITPCRPIK
ncbi:MAG: DUF6933 domain-containing protein [Blastocatellia bacterium]